eukprot:CAMPEP_0115394734 /NCGR_PEP_ID=MMETSP0271-20121206/12419_1 /TAXON_ID=71861 /ORGANISM="Scrippsiella trochoidea, Strain CCMP3099" /LENGTH=405 /DNA_ID=CAMNT_0002818415 /DNA_START=1282 /DNA_END=2499 /DNA_ORIENTATION=-
MPRHEVAAAARASLHLHRSGLGLLILHAAGGGLILSAVSEVTRPLRLRALISVEGGPVHLGLWHRHLVLCLRGRCQDLPLRLAGSSGLQLLGLRYRSTALRLECMHGISGGFDESNDGGQLVAWDAVARSKLLRGVKRLVTHVPLDHELAAILNDNWEGKVKANWFRDLFLLLCSRCRRLGLLTLASRVMSMGRAHVAPISVCQMVALPAVCLLRPIDQDALEVVPHTCLAMRSPHLGITLPTEIEVGACVALEAGTLHRLHAATIASDEPVHHGSAECGHTLTFPVQELQQAALLALVHSPYEADLVLKFQSAQRREQVQQHLTHIADALHKTRNPVCTLLEARCPACERCQVLQADPERREPIGHPGVEPGHALGQMRDQLRQEMHHHGSHYVGREQPVGMEL